MKTLPVTLPAFACLTLLLATPPPAFPQAAAPQGKVVAEKIDVPVEGKQEIKFTANGSQDGTILLLRVRIDFKKIAGATHAMKVRLNDLELTQAALAKPRPNPVKIGAAKTKPWCHAKFGWMVTYAPSFELPAGSIPHVIFGEDEAGPINPFEFRFDVGSLLKNGENVLEIQHTSAQVTGPLVGSSSLVK
jgi:hypothetical protein